MSWPIVNPSYITPLEFEKYDYKKWSVIFTDYWSLSLVASLIYVVLVFAGQKWMEYRKPFKLQGLLISWNVFLSLGSLFMFMRLYPELLNELKNHGLYHSVCNRDEHTIITGFWILATPISKLIEFGDTAFIIARKQKLLFLHWYHHISVCIYCFYVAGEFDPSGRWFTVINTFIHAIMYGYYALKAMKINVPKKFAMVITYTQIAQMVIGVLLNILSFAGKTSGYECARPYRNMFWASVMYASYFYLFVQFFKNTYKQKPKGN